MCLAVLAMAGVEVQQASVIADSFVADPGNSRDVITQEGAPRHFREGTTTAAGFSGDLTIGAPDISGRAPFRRRHAAPPLKKS